MMIEISNEQEEPQRVAIVALVEAVLLWQPLEIDLVNEEQMRIEAEVTL